MITNLFASAGVYPYDPLTIFRNIKTRIGDVTLRSIMDKLPKLRKMLLSQGEFSFRIIIIMRAYVTIKNSVVIYRRRNCLLTCPALIIAQEVSKTEAVQKKEDMAAERKKASEIKKSKREEEVAADAHNTITLGGSVMH